MADGINTINDKRPTGLCIAKISTHQSLENFDNLESVDLIEIDVNKIAFDHRWTSKLRVTAPKHQILIPGNIEWLLHCFTRD